MKNLVVTVLLLLSMSQSTANKKAFEKFGPGARTCESAHGVVSKSGKVSYQYRRCFGYLSVWGSALWLACAPQWKDAYAILVTNSDNDSKNNVAQDPYQRCE